MAKYAARYSVDACEAKGDVWGAWQVLVDNLRGDDRDDWNPDRIRTLFQLKMLEPVLPGWAYSRWILQQVTRTWAGRSAQRRLDALRLTREVTGHEPSGGGHRELDWCTRQLLLFDQGGLEHFLDEVAATELVERADRIREWVLVPMGGYRLLRAGGGTLTWLDLATSGEHETCDLGTSNFIEVGECVVGRLVPIEGGRMFESIPLDVPEASAARVAGSPGNWLEIVGEAYRDPAPDREPFTLDHDYSMLSDVPMLLELSLIGMVSSKPGEDSHFGGRELVDAAIDGRLHQRLRTTEWDFDVWPAVARTLLEPAVLLDLFEDDDWLDEDSLTVLAESLYGPAADLCRLLATERRPAA